MPEPAGDRLTIRWTGTQLHVQGSRPELELREFFPYSNPQIALESVESAEPGFDLVYRFETPPPTELGQGVLAISDAGEPRWIELAAPWPPL